MAVTGSAGSAPRSSRSRSLSAASHSSDSDDAGAGAGAGAGSAFLASPPSSLPLPTATATAPQRTAKSPMLSPTSPHDLGFPVLARRGHHNSHHHSNYAVLPFASSPNPPLSPYSGPANSLAARRRSPFVSSASAASDPSPFMLSVA
eukprot:jgi/Hompol1/1485/HPOL_005605-RA